MEFGLGLLGYHGCWDDAAFAEEHGFSTAGFVDSPLIGGDPYVCLGLAADRTERIRLGTFLAIPSLRSPAVTAAGVGTVNRIAPGRTFIGIATGYTGRQTFGLQAVSAERMREHAQACRDLLAGRPVTHRWQRTEREIRFRHKPDAYLDTEHEIPIYVGADGPKALRAAGEAGDGLVVTLKYSHAMLNSPEVFAAQLAAAREAASEAGRSFDDAYTIWSTVPCVLEPGESAASPRVLERVGASAMMPFHTYACDPSIGEYLPPPLRERLEIYEREVMSRWDVPRDLAYQEAHAGHLSHLLDGEAAVLTDEIVRMTTLTGTAQEIAAVLRRLEEEGLRNVSFWFPPHLTREGILEIEEQLMPLMRGAPA
jgi:alkanesulfonate monooxygenase SsuD/methylene tetrahydromethanopterin reductase-like flavin-dependent oxidoreductase (luciferase family)